MKGEKLLRMEKVSAYYGQFRALEGVSIEIGDGEIAVIVGANGAGKTSLLRVISGVISTRGDIWYEDRNLINLPSYCRSGLGIVHVPEGRGIFPFLTVRENLELGAYPSRNRKHCKERIEMVFQMFPVLKKSRFRYAGSLSGGEQQMLAIGRGLMAEPRLLMLDEPSLGLAPLVVDHIFDIIQELNRENITILLVEQLVGESLEIAHKAYLLSNGCVVLSGSAEKLSNDDRVRSIYMGLT